MGVDRKRQFPDLGPTLIPGHKRSRVEKAAAETTQFPLLRLPNELIFAVIQQTELRERIALEHCSRLLHRLTRRSYISRQRWTLNIASLLRLKATHTRRLVRAQVGPALCKKLGNRLHSLSFLGWDDPAAALGLLEALADQQAPLRSLRLFKPSPGSLDLIPGAFPALRHLSIVSAFLSDHFSPVQRLRLDSLLNCLRAAVSLESLELRLDPASTRIIRRRQLTQPNYQPFDLLLHLVVRALPPQLKGFAFCGFQPRFLDLTARLPAGLLTLDLRDNDASALDLWQLAAAAPALRSLHIGHVVLASDTRPIVLLQDLTHVSTSDRIYAVEFARHRRALNVVLD